MKTFVFFISLSLFCAIAAAQQWHGYVERPSYDIPLLTDIVVDGDGSDWGDRGFCVDVMQTLDYAAGGAVASDDFYPRFRLGWDQTGLIILAAASDDHPQEVSDKTRLYMGDSLDLIFSNNAGGSWQLLASPGADPKSPELKWIVFDHRRSPAQGNGIPEIKPEVASSCRDGEFFIEARLPWSSLGITPAANNLVALQVYFHDRDGDSRTTSAWFPAAGGHADSMKSYNLRLSETPSPAVRMVAVGGVERFRRYTVDVVATPGLTGRTVMVESAAGDTLTSADLTDAGNYAIARMRVPLPQRGEHYHSMDVLTDNGLRADIKLPDIAAIFAAEFKKSQLNVQPVFSGSRLPLIDFKNPGWADYLSGGYEIETTYYDADFNEVTTAETPGRYGAVVSIKTKSGQPEIRYVPMFRQPQNLNWWLYKWDGFAGTLPVELGVSEHASSAQRIWLSEGMKWSLQRACNEDTYMASMLAWLYELPAGAETAATADGPEAANMRWWHKLRKSLGQLDDLNYRVHTPSDYGKDKSKKWPLVLFLHGAGERGDDISSVSRHGPPKLIVAGQDLPFICVWPQCPRNSWWPEEVCRLSDLLDSVEAEYRVDADRIYVTGLSMGGFGSWSMAAHYPQRFAAVAPICGGGNPRDAAAIKDLPIWVFHGGKDAVVSINRSTEMVNALKAVGGNVAYTVYPDAGHDSWTATYDDPRFWQWLLSNKRGEPAKMPEDTAPAINANK